MKPAVKLGIIGCGYWGPNLVRNFRSLPNCEMAMVCDANAGRLRHMKSLYPDLEVCDSHLHAINGAGLDAVVVATPVRHHFSIARDSLMAGKHTMIEKPMAASLAECEELIQIAESKNLILMVGHTFLYAPPIRKIKDIVDWGDIGEIQYVASRRLNLGLFQKDINVTWDLAPHDLSIILHIMGEAPESVSCSGTAHVTPGIEDVTVMYLTFSKKRCAIVHNSWLDPRKVREMTIVGTRRMIVYDDLATLEKIKIFDARVETPPHYDTFAEFQYAYHYGDVYAPHLKQEEPLKVECAHFVECIQQGRQPLTSGRHGAELVRILEAARESLRRGGERVALASVEKGFGTPIVKAA
jgi:predicted dehydrogenase